MTELGGGQIGMFFAVSLVWAIGLAVCVQNKRFYSVITRGGVVVACTQFFPILQIASGGAAIFTFEQLSGGGSFLEGGPRAELAGFAVTLLTAMPLLLAAFVFGGGHRLLISTSAADEDEDAIESSVPDGASTIPHD